MIAFALIVWFFLEDKSLFSKCINGFAIATTVVRYLLKSLQQFLKAKTDNSKTLFEKFFPLLMNQ